MRAQQWQQQTKRLLVRSFLACGKRVAGAPVRPAQPGAMGMVQRSLERKWRRHKINFVQVCPPGPLSPPHQPINSSPCQPKFHQTNGDLKVMASSTGCNSRPKEPQRARADGSRHITRLPAATRPCLSHNGWGVCMPHISFCLTTRGLRRCLCIVHRRLQVPETGDAPIPSKLRHISNLTPPSDQSVVSRCKP